jgi:ribosomal protein S18 acetylase RimI-like enzyme
MRLLNYSILGSLLIFFSCDAIDNIAEIIIRPAILSDIPSALDLDWRIAIEYFKPLFINNYSHTPLGKDPEYFLKLDQDNDQKMFFDCINLVASQRLYVAFDEKLQQVVGLIIFSKKESTILEIELLLIDKNYRKVGLGKKLVNTALEIYKECQTCIAYCFSYNKKALAFYESQGFVVMGPGPQDKITIYGISYADLYVCCRREL